jgi:hypothetical protein
MIVPIKCVEAATRSACLSLFLTDECLAKALLTLAVTKNQDKIVATRAFNAGTTSELNHGCC